jgi:hypothetical protein
MRTLPVAFLIGALLSLSACATSHPKTVLTETQMDEIGADSLEIGSVKPTPTFTEGAPPSLQGSSRPDGQIGPSESFSFFSRTPVTIGPR